LRSRSASTQDKAEKMSWLIHLVGDVHQPLHCATLVNSLYPAPQGDRGGNEFFVRVSATGSPQKLHSLWDGLLGSGTAADARLTRSALNNAIRLQTLYPRATLPELQSHRSVKSWSKESRNSAIHDAYLDGTSPPGENATVATILPAGSTRHAKEIARAHCFGGLPFGGRNSAYDSLKRQASLPDSRKPQRANAPGNGVTKQ
jgi:S1/P1 Nuclease